MEREILKRINKYLAGVALAPTGQPLLRVVWSDSQFESRFGHYEDYYGKIYLRTFIGVRDVKKYGYIERKWVLEKWCPPSPSILKDLPTATAGTYEPLYVFQDAEGNALPLNEEIVKHIVWVLHNPTLKGDRASKIRTEKEVKDQKDDELDRIIMEDASPYLAGKLHGQEAVVVP